MLGPLIIVLFKRLIEGQSFRCCVTKNVNCRSNLIFLTLKRCTATKIQYYSCIKWFLIAMTCDISSSAQIYVDIKKGQVPLRDHVL